MTAPKFSAGDTVRLIPNLYIPAALGAFEITRLLPEERGMYGYRVTSLMDGHVRVVMESEIA
jgi:hypothetical protein